LMTESHGVRVVMGEKRAAEFRNRSGGRNAIVETSI